MLFFGAPKQPIVLISKWAELHQIKAGYIRARPRTQPLTHGTAYSVPAKPDDFSIVSPGFTHFITSADLS